MNKIFTALIKKNNGWLIFLSLLAISLLVYSCRKEKKEEIISTSKILSQNSSDFLSRINAIKIKYYDLNLNEKLNKNTSQNFKWAPNWDNPIVQTVNDTVSYVFFPMLAQKLVDGRLITAKELDSKTYLIVKNEKEYFKGIFYQPSSIGEPKTLSLLHFSGRLLLSNLATKEGFIIDYNNGEPLKTNLSNTVKLNKTSNIGGLSSTTITNCTTIEYCSFMSDGPCRDGSWYLLYRLDCNSIYNSRYSCSNWNLIDYFSETTCETIHTFEDPPMPPEEGGGNSSGDGENQPASEPSKYGTDSLKKIMKPNNCLTDAQFNTLNNMFNEYLNGQGDAIWECLHKAIYNKIEASGKKIGFCVDQNINGNGNYTPSTGNMLWKDAEGLNNVNLFSHEFFHVYQDVHYPGGTNQYGDIGFPNIEFEQALFSDIINEDANAMGSAATQSLRDEYKLWLSSITRDNSSFPKQVSDLQGQYNYFLTQFYQNANGYAGKGKIKTNLMPTALLSIFSIFNCK